MTQTERKNAYFGGSFSNLFHLLHFIGNKEGFSKISELCLFEYIDEKRQLKSHKISTYWTSYCASSFYRKRDET